MTTIIAKRLANGSIEIGFDSLVSGGGGGFHPEKVRPVNGQMLVGVAGYSRYSDVIHYTQVPRVHSSDLESGFDVRGYLVTEAVPAWMKAMKDAHSLDPDTNEDWPKGSILVVIGGRIFTLDSIWAVTEHDSMVGIGSGADFALGALAAGKSVSRALEVAAELDPGTGGQLFVIKGVGR